MVDKKKSKPKARKNTSKLKMDGTGDPRPNRKRINRKRAAIKNSQSTSLEAKREAKKTTDALKKKGRRTTTGDTVDARDKAQFSINKKKSKAKK